MDIQGPVTKDQAQHGFKTIAKAVESAQEIGRLDPASTWAFIALVLMAYIAWDKKQKMKADVVWQDIRLKGIEAASAQATATARVADETEKNSDDLRALRIIIDERLPKGGSHA